MFESFEELSSVESILSRVPNNAFKEDIRIKRRINLFKIKRTSRLCDSAQFSDAPPPIQYMVDYSEVHYRIEASIREREVLCVSHKKGNNFIKSLWPAMHSPCNQFLFQIECVDLFKTHLFYQQSRSLTQAAADFQSILSADRFRQLDPVGYFSPLKQRSYRAVYPDPFRPIHEHCFFLLHLGFSLRVCHKITVSVLGLCGPMV
jgi:hypothetical protein